MSTTGTESEEVNSAVRFVYTNSANETSKRTITQWAENGHYIKGFCAERGRVLTFRKDRIQQYLDGSDGYLKSPISPPPPRPEKKSPRDSRPHILFTGFARVQRAVLEAKADANGLQVVQSVTTNLVFLCGGPNAGPSKMEKARSQGVYIVNEPQLHQLLETGELPDDVAECL